MFVLDTYFWTVFVLVIACGAIAAVLTAAALGRPFRRHRGKHAEHR
ncbi:hypothetical protein [Yinghuangia sp. YIM S09857]